MKISAGLTILLQLDEEAVVADVDVQRIERLHVVELLGGEVALAERRHPQVDEGVAQRRAAARQRLRGSPGGVHAGRARCDAARDIQRRSGAQVARRAIRALDLVDAPVARALEVLELEADGLVRLVELLAPLRASHCGWKPGRTRGDLGEVGAVVALVGAGVLGEGDLAAGHRLLDDLGDVPDAVVLVVAADVEGLRVHRLARRGQDRQEGAADVLDVHDGPPGAAVALEQHLAGGERPGHQVVQHDVEAQPWRDAVGGGAAEEGRAEASSAS